MCPGAQFPVFEVRVGRIEDLTFRGSGEFLMLGLTWARLGTLRIEDFRRPPSVKHGDAMRHAGGRPQVQHCSLKSCKVIARIFCRFDSRSSQVRDSSMCFAQALRHLHAGN